jgi:hypothetical protein
MMMEVMPGARMWRVYELAFVGALGLLVLVDGG